MPEVLARVRHDAVLSRAARPARRGLFAALFRRLRAFPMRGYAGAALTAVLTGIVVNALTLQHARHPAPFFAARPLIAATHRVAIAPPAAAVPAAASRPEASPLASVLPPQRPARLSAGDRPAAAARHVDAIGEILREEAVKGERREILEAQNALIKLGYSIRADGAANSATVTAIHEFERSHSLPLSSEVTTRLLRRLAAAAAAH